MDHAEHLEAEHDQQRPAQERARGAEVAGDAPQRDGDAADHEERQQDPEAEAQRDGPRALGRTVARLHHADDERHAGEVARAQQDARHAEPEGGEQRQERRGLQRRGERAEELAQGRHATPRDAKRWRISARARKPT